MTTQTPVEQVASTAAVGAQIRAVRFSHGWTQDDLARHLQTTRATVASYETGRRKVPLHQVQRIAQLSGKPIAFFFGAAENEATGAPVSQAQAFDTTTAIAAHLAREPHVLPLVAELLHGNQRVALRAILQVVTARPDVLAPIVAAIEAHLKAPYTDLMGSDAITTTKGLG